MSYYDSEYNEAKFMSKNRFIFAGNRSIVYRLPGRHIIQAKSGTLTHNEFYYAQTSIAVTLHEMSCVLEKDRLPAHRKGTAKNLFLYQSELIMQQICIRL